jgi:Mg2+ and Co2+ transporter CorA
MAGDPPQSEPAPVGSNRREASAPRGGPSICQVSRDRGSSTISFRREAVAELLAGGSFFWLDLDRPGASDFEVLRDAFGFHPLAVEDSEHFEQRAKIDDYDDFVFLVVYGAAADGDRLIAIRISAGRVFAACHMAWS